MGWIAIVIICVVLLFLILNVFSSQRGKKSASRQTTAVMPSERSSKEMEDSKVEATEKALLEHTTSFVQKGRQRASKEATTYGDGGEAPRTYVPRHDYQKLFEESIKSPLPEGCNPAALHLLFDAWELEKEGGDQKKIQKLLKEAYELDKDATNIYLTRMSIIKERRNKSHQN